MCAVSCFSLKFLKGDKHGFDVTAVNSDQELYFLSLPRVRHCANCPAIFQTL